jgi:serine protease
VKGSWIPAVSVSKLAGTELLAQPAGTSATVVNAASDWDHYSGTSMASPHVAGAAALVWQAQAGLPQMMGTQLS